MSVVANVAINIDGKQALQLLNAIESEVNKLNGSFSEIPKKTGGIFDKLKGAAGSVVGQLAAVAGAAFTVQQAFTTLAAQSKAEGALRTLGVNATEASAAFMKLSIDLQGQASAVELTAAAYDVASAGFAKVADQTKILEAATKGAVGGMSDINTVGNAVTSVLNAYGMGADQAGKLVDGFIQTQNDGKIILNEYAALIGRLAPTAVAAGVGIEELNAAVATITAQGVAPESAVNGLNQALISILKPTNEASALAQQLGINFNETGLRTKGLKGILEEVAGATKGSATQLTTLFGSVDALKAVLPLLSGDMKKFAENIIKQKEAAGVADKAFNDMSKTIGGALKEVDTAFKNLIVSFEPITPAIITPFKAFATAINFATQNFKELAMAALWIGTFATVINGVAIAQKLWTAAVIAYGIATKVAATAQAFLMSLAGPAGIALVAAGVVAATVATVALGNAMTEAGNKSNDTKGKQVADNNILAGQQTTLNELTKGQAAELVKITPEMLKQKEALKGNVEQVKQQTLQIERQFAALDRGASITAARYDAEKALNDLKIQQLDQEYQSATTAQQRLDIISEILKTELEGAKIEYQQKLESIELEKQKLYLKSEQAKITLKEIEAQGLLAQATGKDAAEKEQNRKLMEQSLAKQREVIHATEELGKANEEVGKYQKFTAETQLKSKELTIQQKFEQKAVSSEVGLTREQAKQLSDGIINNINNTDQLQSSWQNVRLEIEAAARAASFARQGAANSGGGSSGGGGGPKGAAKGAYWQGGFQAFKKGGMVNRPTLGLIGEGGEPEYIIPASKMGSASANYLSGARGSAVIPASSGGGDAGGSSRNGASPQISIQTGPVTQMNGTNYVTTKQLAVAVQAGVSQTLAMISGDINTRASLGIA